MCECERKLKSSSMKKIHKTSATFFINFLSIIILFSSTAHATHFRGGTAWWSPVSNYSDNANKAFRLEYYVGWRNSFQDFECDRDVGERSVIGDSGEWQSTVGELGPADFVCNEHDPTLDWMVGYNEIVVNETKVSGQDKLTIWYTGRCWIDKLYYPGCAWNLTLETHLGIRSDIGKPNSTPRSGSIPIKRLQAGCPTTIEIPTTDPDGDRVRCRFSETADECGDVCQHFPFFTFIEDTCILSYNGGGSEALVTVAVIVEDFPRNAFVMHEGTPNEEIYSRNDVISKIPLQFLVSFYTSDDACNARPFFVRPTPPDGQTVTAIVGSELLLRIYAKPTSSSENITDVVFVFPRGARKTPVTRFKNDIHTVNVTWVPTSAHIGTNIFCFSAKESSSRISEQRCITVVVGDEVSACEIDNGGCSDKCLALGTNYFCECPRDCWALSNDERTCKPDVSIECFPFSMQIKVSTCSVDSDIVTIGRDEVFGPIPEACRKTEVNGSYVFEFNFDECGTFYQEDFWNITYYNHVRLFADLSEVEGSSPITRGKWYAQGVSCTFAKFGNLTSSFQPQNIDVLLLDVPGLGSFSFFIDFYNNVTFDEATSPYDYPVPATINSDIYFAVRAVGGSPGMQLYTMRCDALPTSDVTETTPRYSMISNGCLEDATMREYPTNSPMEKRYSIKAFQFRDSLLNNQSAVVFIQCQVVVCTVGSTITTCSQGCIDATARKKREIKDALNYRYRRQSLNEDDDEPINNSNVTETPLHDVRSDGGVQILINSAPNTDIDFIITDPGNNGDNVVTEEELGLALLSIKIGIIVGGLAIVLFLAVVGVVCYHNKVVRPRAEVQPTYVQDIYLPKNLMRGNHKRSSVSKKITQEDVLWARRVVRLPTTGSMTTQPNYKMNSD